MKKKKNNKGFSLIELLIGLGVSCIVLVAAYSFIMFGIRSYDMTRKNTEIQQEAQFVENIIVDAVENGNSDKSQIIDPMTIDGKSCYVFKTGRQVIYYDSSKKELYIYDDAIVNPSEDALGTNTKKHLISKCVDAFDVKYLVTEYETAADGSRVTTLPAGTTTDLVQVHVKVSKNGKKEETKKQYKFRNSEQETTTPVPTT